MFSSPHPFLIRLTSRVTTVLRTVVPNSTGAAPVAAKMLRHRFRAEFVTGPFAGLSVEGYASGDAAIGALVRRAAEKCSTPGQVIDLVARMLDRPASRTADETIGRTVRCAALAPKRRNAGVKVHFANPEARPQLTLHKAPERGGAA